MTDKKKPYNYDTDIKELSSLEEKKIKVTVETISGYRNIIKIVIDHSLINSNLIDKDEEIVFILLIKYNHPITPPLLHCTTKFSVPELSDGRDYLEEVLLGQWIPKRKNTLKRIISLIPNFINDYLQRVAEQKELRIIGKYYLDNSYELSVLKMFPHLYFGDIIEIVAFGNDKRVYDEKRIIMITEGFILLFVEKGIFETQKLKLIFWGPISSLSLMKQINNRKVIELTWKAKKDKTSLMRLKTENDEEIFQILMECLTKKKIEFKVQNESSGGKKKGEIPQVDIVAAEQEISKLEIKIKIKGKDGANAENTKQLMNLYEKAVQYYSALNDYRYQIYMRKTKKLISQMSDKDLGVKKGVKKSGEGVKKKGKKGKGKKEKEKIKENKVEEKKEEKKEVEKDKGDGNANQKEKNEEKKEEKKEIIEEKKEEKVEEKKEEKKEEKGVEEKKEKIEEKKEEKKEENKEENKEEKKEEKKGEEKVVEKKEEKADKTEEKQKVEKTEDTPKQNIENKKEEKKEEVKEKSEVRQKFEKSGFDLDLDDD